jgi:hypothetical protein
MAVALLVPGAAQAAPAPAGLDEPNATIDVRLGSCIVSGTVSGLDGEKLRVVHRNASGAVLSDRITLPVSGEWLIECPGPAVRIGHRLELFKGNSPDHFRRFTIPELRVTTDRTADRVIGTARRTDLVAVQLFGCDVDFYACTGRPLEEVPVDPATGRFRLDSAENVRGGWTVEVTWSNGPHTVLLEQKVERLVVRPGSAVVGGFGSRSGQSVAVRLERGDRIGLANPTTRADASFSATIRRNGSPMKAKAGDRVSASFAGDAFLTVPPNSLGFTGTTIDGRCFRNGGVVIRVFGADDSFVAVLTATADGDGFWTVSHTLLAGHKVKATCGNAKGDALVRELVAL